MCDAKVGICGDCVSADRKPPTKKKKVAAIVARYPPARAPTPRPAVYGVCRTCRSIALLVALQTFDGACEDCAGALHVGSGGGGGGGGDGGGSIDHVASADQAGSEADRHDPISVGECFYCSQTTPESDLEAFDGACRSCHAVFAVAECPVCMSAAVSFDDSNGVVHGFRLCDPCWGRYSEQPRELVRSLDRRKAVCGACLERKPRSQFSHAELVSAGVSARCLGCAFKDIPVAEEIDAALRRNHKKLLRAYRKLQSSGEARAGEIENEVCPQFWVCG